MRVEGRLTREQAWGWDGASLESVSAFSHDPAASSPNLYQYCGNNPLQYTDPLGLATSAQLNAPKDWTDDGPCQNGKQKQIRRNPDLSKIQDLMAKDLALWGYYLGLSAQYRADAKVYQDLADTYNDAYKVAIAAGPETWVEAGALFRHGLRIPAGC